MKTKSSGFTLIELMIALAVISILAAVALPAYRDQTQKTRRADGKSLLTSMAQQLERCYTKYSRYDDANCTIQNGAGKTSENGYYTVTPAGITATTYTLTAVRQGAQASDSTCGNLSLDQTGQQSYSGTGSKSECW